MGKPKNTKSSTDGAIFSLIEKIGNGINKISDRIENIKGSFPEILAMLLYTVGHFMMMLVHEPWFDEALAWLIARDSSIKQILFEAPHYEGHPGLWHLMLAPFAKLGAPYELSLAVISFIFSGAAIAILIWKAPFKRILRLLLPFTYFLFYQYSVVSRPYCMMMLAFALIALFYKDRNIKPGRYVAALAFLCATSAYGVVIAGGMCIAWLIQLWAEAGENAKNQTGSRIKGFFKGVAGKGKIFYLAALLAYALSIIVRIMPTDKTYATIRAEMNPSGGMGGFLRHLFYTMFGSLPDTVLTNTYSDLNVLSNAGFSRSELITSGILGILILIVIFVYGRKKREALTFFIPYTMLAVFSAIVYIFTFHIGIFLLFTICWLWICEGKKSGRETDGELTKAVGLITEGDNNAADTKAGTKATDREMLKKAGLALVPIFITLTLVISFMWTITSCIADADSEYGFGRNESNYLKAHGLEKASILCDWNPVFKPEMAKEGYDEFDVAFAYSDVCVAPYLEDAVILNHMDELGLEYALIHRTNDSKENAEIIRKISEKGTPEVLMGLADLAVFFELKDVNITDYMKVYSSRYGTVWKGTKGLNSSAVYVRRDIAEEKGLKEIKIERQE
ncbi:MAG: hypothetical protein MJ131_01215 [Lachnospiraceae bacterium]|nr:hypothetical protein [Lachnospiraceae bacterium]